MCGDIVYWQSVIDNFIYYYRAYLDFWWCLMNYINVEGTDIPVKVVEFLGQDRVLVTALHGKPFAKDVSYQPKKYTAVRRCVASQKIVQRGELKNV